MTQSRPEWSPNQPSDYLCKAIKHVRVAYHEETEQRATGNWPFCHWSIWSPLITTTGSARLMQFQRCNLAGKTRSNYVCTFNHRYLQASARTNTHRHTDGYAVSKRARANLATCLACVRTSGPVLLHMHMHARTFDCISLLRPYLHGLMNFIHNYEGGLRTGGQRRWRGLRLPLRRTCEPFAGIRGREELNVRGLCVRSPYYYGVVFMLISQSFNDGRPNAAFVTSG